MNQPALETTIAGLEAGESRIAKWLVDAYPQLIAEVRDGYIVWQDGSSMELAPVAEQFVRKYPVGADFSESPRGDPGRHRHPPFFEKMYGATRAEVEANLVDVAWLPRTTKKTLRVTRINGVAKKLVQISADLDALPVAFKKFLVKPGGGYNWRTVNGSEQLSPHAFGIAVDINIGFGNYWRWDLERLGRTEYRNRIPQEIVDIFERHGFIWGGKWEHYDTMHFEYRPELLLPAIPTLNAINVLYLTRGGEAYGSERQLGYLIQGLNPAGFAPIILRQHERVERGNGTHESTIASTYFPLRPWRKVAHILTRHLDAHRLLRFAQLRQIGLIHCSHQWLLPYALHVGRRLDIPVVLHIRRPGNSSEKLLRMGILQCHAVIAISKKIQSELNTIPGLAERVHLISDAVDLSLFHPQAGNLRAELGIPSGELLIGMVARVYKTKRQLEFVRVMEKLVSRGHRIHGVIVGRIDDPDYGQALKDAIALHGLQDRCHLLGHREDINEIIPTLDILLSLAGGSVMYEAMACGKLVISAGFTRREHSTHVVDGVTGLVTDSRDEDTLIDLLEMAINDKALRQRLGDQAIEWARLNFSHTALAEHTQALYRKVLR